MFAMNHNSFRKGMLALTTAALTASSAHAYAWLYHQQRVQDPIGVGAESVAIKMTPNGYTYLANHVSPLFAPLGQNIRPTFVRTGPSLAAQTCFTYARPSEWNTLYTTQLYLSSTDMEPTTDGGFIVCGNYTEVGADEGAFLLKVDAGLNAQWFRQYPAQQPSAYVGAISFNSVVQTTLGGNDIYIACGGVLTTSNGEPLVAAFDSLGIPIWTLEIPGANGGFGEANEVIVYDQDSIAIVGSAQVRPHVHCQNFTANGDVLVARIQNDGLIEFVGLYGQSTGMIGGTQVSFYEHGRSLTRPTGSQDLMITGGIQAWTTADECPGGPAVDDMLAFRINPVGNVVWANRYDVGGGSYEPVGVRIQPVTAFAMIVANGWNTLNSVYSENIAFYRLMAGSGALAQQTELYGGDQVERAAAVIPLGPPWPYGAMILGTTNSFANIFHSNPKPYLIERMPSAQQRCADAEVTTTIVPVPLPQHEVLINAPVFPNRTQPLVLISQTVSDYLICANIIVGDLDNNGVISVGDIGAFVLALTNPNQYEVEYPDGDLMAADINNDGVVSVGDIGAFVALITSGGGAPGGGGGGGGGGEGGGA